MLVMGGEVKNNVTMKVLNSYKTTRLHFRGILGIIIRDSSARDVYAKKRTAEHKGL